MRISDSNRIIRKLVGQRIATIREEKGFTQTNFARMIEIDRSSYNRIENGLENPTIKTLVAIADGLNVPISELWEYAKDAPPADLAKRRHSYGVQKVY